MKFEIEIADQILIDEPELKDYMKGIEQMVNRMLFSHYKYGAMGNKYPSCAKAIESVEKRKQMYEKTGNTENCLDAANFYVIEYVCPSHPKAHFAAQTSAQSPGLTWRAE